MPKRKQVTRYDTVSNMSYVGSVDSVVESSHVSSEVGDSGMILSESDFGSSSASLA